MLIRLLYIEQSDDDGLCHRELDERSDMTWTDACSTATVCFKDLEADAVVDDLILFSGKLIHDDLERTTDEPRLAGDAAFIQVPHPSQSPSRVYVLKFSSSNQRMLYWMQSTDSSTDARNARRLNQLIDDPTSVEAAEGSDAMAVDA